MRCLVTGGSGFIGSHLCEELLRRRFEVVALDNLSTGNKFNIAHLLSHKNFKFYKGSILDEKLIRRLVKRCDIVYHMAAAVGVKFILDHPVGSLLTNIEGTHILLKAATRYCKKVVLASTSEIYGKHLRYPIRETDDRTLGSTSTSRWSYADAKAVDELLAFAYAKEKGLPIVIVRLFNTVGPRQVGRYGMVLPRFIEEAFAGRPITVYGDGTQVRTFTYILDAVRVIVGLSLKKGAEGEAYNVGSNQSITIKALARKVKQKTHSSSPIQYISYKKAYGRVSRDFEDIQYRIPNISKITKTLGYRPRYGIDSIIEHTIRYFRERHKAKI